MNTFDDPRIGQTYRRNARSPRRARLLSLVFGAIDRLGLGRPLMRLLVRPRGRLSPSANTAAFAGYTPTRHDVFICTYAKSGTNLLLQMVHQITRGGAGDFEHIHDVAPWPDSIHPTGADLEDDHHLRAAIPLRAIKTHLTADHVPYSPEARYIVVVRDPRDVLVSAYHFAHSVAQTLTDARFTPAEWIAMALADRLTFGSWAAHTASWWPLRRRANVLVLNFAALLRDPDRAIRRVAAFVGVDLDDEAFARVRERCSFAWMRAHDAAFRPPLPPLPGRPPPVMVRAGKVGEASAFTDPATLAELEAFFAAELRRRGSDFPLAALLAGEALDDDDAAAGPD
ncbi:MAG: sulfotransferase domain-containing protein [Myxococcales bacterium]|nr:sulfotransferase domain-containing protein [Myxococcales bacterium]